MSRFLKQTESAMKLTRQNNAYALHNRLLIGTADVEELDANGNTPLLVAAYNGFTECLAELLDLGAANYKQINVFGQNALTLATFAGSELCVHRLLERWTYEEYTSASLTPPLCVAAMRGHMALVVKFAAMYPSAEHIQTVHAVDAMMLAMIHGHKDIWEYLHQAHVAAAATSAPTTHGIHMGRTVM